VHLPAGHVGVEGWVLKSSLVPLAGPSPRSPSASDRLLQGNASDSRTQRRYGNGPAEAPGYDNSGVYKLFFADFSEDSDYLGRAA
jgi:hypothetical protein